MSAPSRRAAFLLLALVATGCATLGGGGGSASRDADRRDWIELFDGKTLNGWIPKFAKSEPGVNFANTFTVDSGMIKARYDGYGPSYDSRFGHLYYEKPFSHYLVSLDYRFVGELAPGAPAYTIRNSGIMVHSQDPRTMPRDQNFPISIEMQFYAGLDDGRPRPTGNMCSPGTALDYQGKPDNRHCINSSSKTYALGEWVRAEALVLGDSIVKHIINGDTVLVYTKPRMARGVVTGHDPAHLVEGQPLTSGYIALQAEGHPIDFKNIRLLNLEGCADPTSKRYKSYVVKPNPAAC